MGSICSNQKRNEGKPPTDLAELLQQTEKVRDTADCSGLTDYLLQTGLPSAWLAEFQRFLTDLDTRTKLTWRVKLLEFVLESRTIIKLSKESPRDSAKEETLTNLILQLEERFFSNQGGLSVSDSKLREKLLKELEDFRGLVRGAKGVRQGEGETGRVLDDDLIMFSALEGGSVVSVSSIVRTLQEVYLDPSVWDKLDRFYLQFLSKNPTLPTLAVLLSIL